MVTSSNTEFDGSIMDSIRQKAQRIQVIQVDQPLNSVEKIASVSLGIWLIKFCV